jgi:hypothetical protein
VHEPHSKAEGQDQERGQGPWNAAAGDEVDEDYPEKSDHRTDRKIDAAGDDDETLPDRKHAEEADQVGGVGDVDWREEPRVDERHDGTHHNDQDEESQVLL